MPLLISDTSALGEGDTVLVARGAPTSNTLSRKICPSRTTMWVDVDKTMGRKLIISQLINIDLSGDGAQHNGLGDLIDINTREIHQRALLDTPFDPLTESEKQKKMLKWHLGSNKSSKRSNGEPVINIADLAASISATVGKRGAFVDLVSQIEAGASSVFSKREWEEFSSLAESLGVSPEQIEAAKKAASENLSPEQQADVQNAVKHALWSSRHHGERGNSGSAGQERDSIPGPAFLFRMRDVEEEEDADEAVDVLASLLNVEAKVKVLGHAPQSETGVMSTESSTTHGAPLLVAGTEGPAGDIKRRSVEEDMGGAPGYIDITVSPVTRPPAST